MSFPSHLRELEALGQRLENLSGSINGLANACSGPGDNEVKDRMAEAPVQNNLDQQFYAAISRINNLTDQMYKNLARLEDAIIDGPTMPMATASIR